MSCRRLFLATLAGAAVLTASGARDAGAAAARLRDLIRVHPLAQAPHAAAPAAAHGAGGDSRAAALRARLRQWRAGTAGGVAGLAALQARAGADVRVRLRPDTGTPREIRAARLAGGAASLHAGAGQDEDTARAFLRVNARLLRLDDPDRELRLERRHQDELGRRHLRFAQTFRGVPVWPAELTVHLDPGGNVDLMNGAYVVTPRRTAGTPTITAAAAVARARDAAGLGDGAEATELIVFAPGDRPPRLAWKIEIRQGLAARWLVVVDAQSGAVLLALDQITDDNVAGSGLDLFGERRPLNVWREDGAHYLVDTSKPMYDPTSDPPSAERTRGGIVVLDARNREPDGEGMIPLALIASPTATAWPVADAVSAAFGLSETYDYFLERHGRDSLDGEGGTLLGVVRFSNEFRNAFWNGTLMVFGDGLPYAGALDIVAHELTHGVTEKTANLVYRDQSGAVNEALSDIFGEMVEARTFGDNDWLIGSVLAQPSRNMADPNALEIAAGRVYPARLSELIAPDDPFLDNFKNRDNGGVHLNSSIINHAFYQLAEGLPAALGLRDAARIFHRAQTVHLVASSQFIDLRLAAVASAEELFGAGSAQAQRSAEAFDVVEIFDGTGTPDPRPFPPVAGPDATLFAYYDPESDAYFLGRRETALGDDPEFGAALSAFAIAGARPAVVGDGSYAFFVDSANDICAILTDGSEPETCLDFAGSVFSIALAPDGSRVALVLLDDAGEPENRITVIDLENEETETYLLRAPELDGGGLNTVLYAEAMDFTADGRFLLYDAFNVIEAGGDAVGVWSIYALDLLTDTTLTIVPPVPGFDLSFPSLSQTSDNFLTFDAFDQDAGVSTIITANLDTGDTAEVGAVGGFGVPGYTGDDAAVVYSQVSPSALTGFELRRQPLAADSISPAGASTLWLSDGDFGVVYRRGPYTGPPPTPTPTRRPTTGSATPTPGRCFGDCNDNDAVSIDELVRGVSIALGAAAVAQCPRFDANGNNEVSISELVQAVNAALAGCAS